MTIRCLTLIVFLASFCGCTVEKRLYRKGWNVSMNRHWKGDRPETEDRQHERIAEEAGTAEMTAAPEIREPEQSLAVSVTDSVQLTNIDPEEEVPAATETASVPDQEADTVYMTPQEYRKWRRQNHIPWSLESKTRTTVLLGCLTVLMVGLALLLLYSSIGTMMTVELFILSLLGAIMLLFIAMGLLIGFFIALSRPSQEAVEAGRKEKRLLKEERTAELKDLPKEEQDRILAEDEEYEKRQKKRNAGIIFGAVVLVLAALLFIGK